MGYHICLAAIFLLSAGGRVSLASVYQIMDKSSCLLGDSNLLDSFAAPNELLCAYKCSKNAVCSFFTSTNGSCRIYKAMNTTTYNTLATSNLGTTCKTWKLVAAPPNIPYKVFTSSGQFTVPNSIYALKLLVVGGGAGGGWQSLTDGGGGGSGTVSYLSLNVIPNQVYDVTVGKGGAASSSGGNSSFGNGLVVAVGGNAANNFYGGAGGSGGGAGLNAWGGTSGNGGTGGNNGQMVGYSGGSGQGASFSTNFGQFKLNTISAGPGAAGVSNVNANFIPGGGGGGGVLINGAGPTSSNNSCLINGVRNGPGPASGYGAGGSGGCRANGGGTYLQGESGADGVVYIEY